MRDPARIQPTLAKIAEVWFRHPDMRLGQLLFALTGKDPYYVEDVDLITGAGMSMRSANYCGQLCDVGRSLPKKHQWKGPGPEPASWYAGGWHQGLSLLRGLLR